MVTPVARVVELGLAGRAEREASQARAGAVVGQPPQHRGARAAVAAADERIAVTPVAWSAQVVPAGLAGGGVAGDESIESAFVGARLDAEIGRFRAGDVARLDAVTAWLGSKAADVCGQLSKPRRVYDRIEPLALAQQRRTPVHIDCDLIDEIVADQVYAAVTYVTDHRTPSVEHYGDARAGHYLGVRRNLAR